MYSSASTQRHVALRSATAPKHDRPATLGKQDRGEPPAALDRGLVGRPPGIEELNELLAGAVVVPFAVAPDDGDQILERLLPAALAVEREREVEARLVVERIGRHLLLELSDRPERLGLLGQLQGGARRRDCG